MDDVRMSGLNSFSRTEMLIGTGAMEKLAASRVAVFGIGGVGSFAVEALVRAGVGKLDDQAHVAFNVLCDGFRWVELGF